MTNIYSRDQKENLYELQETKYSETEKQTALSNIRKAKLNIKAAWGAYVVPAQKQYDIYTEGQR